MTKRSFAGIVISLVFIFPIAAAAQDPANTLKDIQSSIEPGDTIRLDGVDGKRVEGILVNVTNSTLKVKVKGVSREFQEPQIKEIRVKYSDPVWNGVKWGVIIGGISGAVVGAVVSDAFCDGCGNAHVSGAIVFGLLGTGTGAGVGALSDSLRNGYTPVFKAPKNANTTFGVSPILSKRSKAVAVAFRF